MTNPDIVLIYPKTKPVEFEEVEPPYSILFPGSYIAEHGRYVKLYDQRVTSLREIVANIVASGTRYVGVSTMTGPQLRFAMQVSQQVKSQAPSVKIIWGGVHPTLLPESCLAKDYVDLVVRGEGEETLLDVLDALDTGRPLSGVPGVSYREGETILHAPDRPFMDIDRVSLNWNLLDEQPYIKTHGDRRMMAFVTGRGCPFRCAYCWNTVVHNRMFRGWSVEKTREELKKVIGFGVNHVSFYDEMILSNPKRWFAICDFMAENDVHWSGAVRAEMVNEKYAPHMKNCAGLFIGAESGSDRTLELILKDSEADAILECARVLKKYGVDGNFSWMMGFPGERSEDLHKTLQLVDQVAEVQPEAAQRLRIYTPYPGTALYNQALEYGFKEPDRLEDWVNFSREDCAVPYVKDPWYLKCISYVSFFHFYQNKRRYSKPIYRPILALLKFVSKLRWKHKWFKLPVEFWLIEKANRVLLPTRGD